MVTSTGPRHTGNVHDRADIMDIRKFNIPSEAQFGSLRKMATVVFVDASEDDSMENSSMWL